MPKPPQVRAREVMRVAESLGFVFDLQTGSHAVYYRASDRRRVVIPMHGTKDLRLGTLRAIVQDLGLTIDEFVSAYVSRSSLVLQPKIHSTCAARG